jgi:hypothetical protein
MLTAIALAALLDSPAVATVTWTAHVAMETHHAALVERHAKAERLGEWLSQLDGERIASAAWLAWGAPFDAEPDASDPFDGEGR